MKALTKTLTGSAIALLSTMVSAQSTSDDGKQRTTLAAAQPSDASRPLKESTSRGRRDIEEVVVTAQKREERLQDVPISISVLTGMELDRRVEGVTDVLNQVPGVSTLVGGSFGTTQIAVRGVTAASGSLIGTSTVGYYLDSIPFGLVRSAIAPDSSGYDLKRIEILRGPQGTLYGASSVNGVVRILTNDANLDRFEVKVRGAASATRDGGENYRGDLAVNVPIVEGKFAARAVLGYEDLSGWIDRPNKEDANDAELKNLRLKLNAAPTENLSIAASAWAYRSDYAALSNGRRDRTNISLIDEPVATDYDTFGLQIDYEFPTFQLSSSSGYLDYQNHSKVDYVALFGPSQTGQVLNTAFDSRIFSQEINLSSTGEGPWRWTAGAIYRDGKDKFFQWRAAYLNPSGNRSYDTSESFAGFGTLTRLFFDGKFEVTGGLRYFEDEQVMQETSRLSVPPGGVPSPPLFRREAKFDAVSPQATLTWHPTADLTAYASYGEGFRSGFSQLSVVLSQAPEFPPVEPDNLVNYEVGAKGSLWGGLVNFDSAVYYIKWRDVQQQFAVSVTSGGAAFNVAAPVNGKSASGLGFEVALTLTPMAGLDIGLNYGWNDLTMDTDVISSTGAVLFLEGDRLGFSPEESCGGSVNYDFPLGASDFRGRVGASVNYISALEARALVNGTQVVVTGDSMLTSRASLSLEAPRNWIATLYGENLNDQRGTPYPSALPTQNIRIRPRTIGLQLEYRF